MADKRTENGTIMVKKICITSVVACIVTFLLFAFAWWNINPAMWSDGGRIGCAAAMAISIFICILTFCMFEDI